jgi:chorismate mutase
MNRQEFKDAVEKCCEAIEKNNGYKSYDAVLEIMKLTDEYHKIGGAYNVRQLKSGELFECEGNKYIIQNVPLASQKDNLENGQSIFILKELE